MEEENDGSQKVMAHKGVTICLYLITSKFYRSKKLDTRVLWTRMVWMMRQSFISLCSMLRLLTNL